MLDPNSYKTVRILEIMATVFYMDNENSSNQKPKKRSLTELTLGWLAERLRRSDEIKEAVKNGTYEVDSEKLASKIVQPEQ